MLDIEVAAAVAPGAKIVVYFTPNTDQGFIDAITTAVHDTTNKPSVISISWGGPESTWTAQSMTALDAACQSAAALGITITVAAGDNGSTDGGDGQQRRLSGLESARAGLRRHEARSPTAPPSSLKWCGTSWPTTKAPPAAASATSSRCPAGRPTPTCPHPAQTGGGRGVPDVGRRRRPNHRLHHPRRRPDPVIGGTSAVAPLWAGLIAVANQQLGTQVGFIQPAIYAAKAASAFNDITQGNNGAFSAGPGWDACTGLGSPIASATDSAAGRRRNYSCAR